MYKQAPRGGKNTNPTAAVLGYLVVVFVTGGIFAIVALLIGDVKGSKGEAKIGAILITGLYFGIAQGLTKYFQKRFFKRK